VPEAGVRGTNGWNRFSWQWYALISLLCSELTPLALPVLSCPFLYFVQIDVIVRTGIPHLQSDLRHVSANSARAIVVLADRNTSEGADAADINTVRTVLSLRGMGAPTNGHIVAEVLDVDNEPLVSIVGTDSLETFVSHDIIGRLMIQCARERGLAQVLENLLGFDGSEFYVKEWPQLSGLCFGQIMFHFADAIVIGVIRRSDAFSSSPRKTSSQTPLHDGTSVGSNDPNALIMLNPPNDLLILPGDRIIVVAEDDDTYSPSPDPLLSLSDEQCSSILLSAVPYVPRERLPESLLFVGWRRDMEDMIAELDKYVCPGSHITLYNHLTIEERKV
jgi:ion channel POLLUX/CASTOR